MEKRLILDRTNGEKAEAFFSVYKVESAITAINVDEEIVFGEVERKCRFCRKSTPETTFKKKAHMIPQFMGNRYILSSFECDACNSFFGRLYEDSFASFIGAYRPFSFVPGSKSNKFPKHKETKRVNDEEKTRLSVQLVDRAIKAYHEAPFDNTIEINDEEKKITIHAERKPYTPIYVYKMLLKIALCMIQDEELDDFNNTVWFLMNNSQNDKMKEHPMCYVYTHQVFGPPLFTEPSAYMYSRIEGGPHPAKTFVLYSGNHIYQIFLPFDKNDDALVGTTIRLLPYPLLFDQSVYDGGITYSSYGEMMSGNEKVYNESQKLVFSFDEHIKTSDT